MHSALRALLSLPLVDGKFVFTLIKSAVVIMLIFGGKLFLWSVWKTSPSTSPKLFYVCS